MMMTIFSRINPLLAALIIAASAGIACAQPSDGFAASLMAEKDYFRAISVYKELSFYANDTTGKIDYSLKIGKAYRLGGKYELSISTFQKTLRCFSINDSLKNYCYLNIGLDYLLMKSDAQAYGFTGRCLKTDSSGMAFLYAGLYQCLVDNWDSSAIRYRQAANRLRDSSAKNAAAGIAAFIADSAKPPTKSPLAAFALSAACPGLGQLYCGHTVDAVQAMFFTGGMLCATFAFYKYDSHFDHRYVGTGISVSVASLFYLSNIFGATRTARYYNERQRELVFNKVRDRTLLIDY
jgi:tetratricopeptide (TPR) repeat protein